MHQSPQPRLLPVPGATAAAAASSSAGVMLPARPGPAMPPAAAALPGSGVPTRPTSVFVPPPLQPPPSAMPASSPTATAAALQARLPPMGVSTLQQQQRPPNIAPFNPAMSLQQRPTPTSSPPPISSPSVASTSSLSASPTSTMSSPVTVYKPLTTPSSNTTTAAPSPLSTASPYISVNTPRVVSPLNADTARLQQAQLHMRPPMPSVSPPPSAAGTPATQPMRLGGTPALSRPPMPTPSPTSAATGAGVQTAYNWSTASVPAAASNIKPAFPAGPAPFNPSSAPNMQTTPAAAISPSPVPPARILSPPVPGAQVSPVAAAAGQNVPLRPNMMMPSPPPTSAVSPPPPQTSPILPHAQLPRPPSQTFTMPASSSRPALNTFVDTSLHSGNATPSSAVPSRPHSASPPPQPESNTWPGSLYAQSPSPPAPAHSLSATAPAFPSNASFSNVAALSPPTLLVPQIRSASTGSSHGGLTPSSSTLSLRKRAMHSYDGEENASPASGSGYNTPSLPYMQLSRPGSNHGSAEASPLGTPRVFFPNQSNQPQAFFPGISSSNTPVTGGTPAAQNSPNGFIPNPYGNPSQSNGTQNPYQNNSWRSKDADLESYDNGKTKATLRNKGVGWGVYVGIFLLVAVIAALFFFNPLKLFSSKPSVVEMQYVHNYHNPYHKTSHQVVDAVKATEDANIDDRPPPIRPELGIHIPASPNQAKSPMQFAQEKAKEQQERMRKQAEDAARYRAELDANPEAKAKYEAELARVEEERKAVQKLEEDRLNAAKEKQEKEEAEKAAEAAAKAKAKVLQAQREAVEKKRQAHEKKVAERAAREKAEAENAAAIAKAHAEKEKAEAEQKAKADQDQAALKEKEAAAAIPAISPEQHSAESKARRKRDLNSQLDEQHIHGAEVDTNQHPVSVQVHEGSHDLHADVTHDSHSVLTQMSVDPVTGEVINLAPKFKFTVMNALEMSQCIGDIPSVNQKRVAIVGNSQARAFYFQLLNAILDSRHEPIQTLNRHDQKNLCAVTLLKNHENLHELTASNLTPSCPIVLPHIMYYYVQEFYDPVLEKILESSPHMIVMMGVGMLDVMDSSTAISSQFHGDEHAVSLKAHEAEWLPILHQKRERLETMIKAYTRGGEHSFTAFALPPLCGSKYYSSHSQLQTSTGMALMTRVGLELKQFNELLQDITVKSGGNWFALDTYVPTSKEQNSAAPIKADSSNQALTGSSLCSLYEDGMHAGLMLRKLVLNNFMNLMCKKIERIENNLKKAQENNDEPIVGWNHKRNDDYTYSQIPLIDGGLKKVLPTPNAVQSQQMAARPTVPVIPRIQMPVLKLSPDEIRHCVNTQFNVEGKRKKVVFLGSSNMRSLYVTFMNQLLEHFPGVEQISEHRLQSKRLCNLDVQQFVTKDTLKASCPVIQTPPAHGLFSFIFSRSVWDDLVQSTFETEPDVLINMAGYTELLSNGDAGYAAQSQKQAESLTHAIRNLVLKGRNYIEFTSPPVCEHKQRGPRISNTDVQAQNALISSLVSSSGGNILDTVSFVQGLHHSTEYKSAMDIHGCNKYEDGVHPNLDMRLEITNSLWNLLCQPKLERPFYFKKGDTMTVTK